MERELLAMYADPALDHKPELLEQRGGAYYSEAAVALLASLAGDRRDTQVVNLRNARHAAVPAGRRGDRGARGDRRGRPAAGPGWPRWTRCCAAWSPTCPRTRNSRWTPRCAAAGTGCSAALLAHPLVGQFDLADGADRPADRRERGLPAVGGRGGGRDGRVTDGLPAVLAVDGGNSKTDVALVAADGTLLGTARGPGMRVRHGPARPGSGTWPG